MVAFGASTGPVVLAGLAVGVPSVPAGAGAPIDRALVIGDRVLTVSTGGILVSDLATLHAQHWVPFT